VKNKAEISVRLAIVGSPRSGKTTLVKRFTGTKIPVRYIPTIGVNQKKQKIQYKNALVESVFWDLAGQELFRGASDFYVSQTEAVIILFDLSNKVSWRSSFLWAESIRRKRKGFSVFVVGNKADMVLDPESRMIEVLEILGNMPIDGDYIVSAKTGFNVDPMFYSVIGKTVYEKLKPKTKRRKTKRAGALSVSL
jgi:small GTP-binding protein